jgi:hypothetical protein
MIGIYHKALDKQKLSYSLFTFRQRPGVVAHASYLSTWKVESSSTWNIMFQRHGLEKNQVVVTTYSSWPELLCELITLGNVLAC